jgi:hypothetical protein
MNQALSGHAPCNACGYDLHGLPLDGTCPECGRLVADSLRGDALRFASPDYLATIRKGIDLYLAMAAAEILLAFASFPVASMVAKGAGVAQVENLLLMVGVVLSLAGSVGFVQFTAPDPALIATEQPRNARRLARVGMIMLIAAGVGRFVHHMLFGGANMTGLFPGFGLPIARPSIFSLAESLVTAAGFLLFFFGGLRYAAWLFRRVPDLRGVRMCTLYMWLLPLIAIVGLCVCVGPLVAKVLHMVLLWLLRGHLAQALRQQRLGMIVVAGPPSPQDPSSGRQP